MVYVLAYLSVFGVGLLIAAALSAVLSKSEWGSGVAVSVNEMHKLTPVYWNKAARAEAAVHVRQPSLVGRSQPVWTPDSLPAHARPRRRQPLSRPAPPTLHTPAIMAPAPAPAASIDIDWLFNEQPRGNLAALLPGSPRALDRAGI